ncbi:threonine synthase [Symmachiella dynata]|nr:threonine synthase [Symmachiella dynata]
MPPHKPQQCRREFATEQEISTCPRGGAIGKSSQQHLRRGLLKSDERIVLFNTGSGLKSNHLFPFPVPKHADSLPKHFDCAEIRVFFIKACANTSALFAIVHDNKPALFEFFACFKIT